MKSDNKELLNNFVAEVDKASGFVEFAKMIHTFTTWVIIAMIGVILFSDNIRLIRSILIYTIVLRVIMNILIVIAFHKVRNGLKKVIEKDVTS
jgi:hypothetical protein